jgi:hypothetical protein
MNDRQSLIAGRLAAVNAAIARSLRDHGRPAGAAALIAVSKTCPPDAIRPVLEAGQRCFGENYVQEAKAKWPELRAVWPDVELHFIGPLQSNKAGDAVRLFDVIHSLDRESLARELARQMQRQDRRPRCLVQVNTGDEAQKAGVAVADLGRFLALCRDELALPVTGLMCIPPAGEPPSPHFALLAKLARAHGLEELSMGMSADFDAAIQLGATCVRIGSAIFGERPAKA